MKRLRDERIAQGMSLREMSYFARCSHTTLARLERGDLTVAAAIKVRVAHVLGIPVAELFDPESGTDDVEAVS